MTNPEWVELISKEFNVNRTIAKKMLHGMYEARKQAIGLVGTRTDHLIVDEFITEKKDSRR